VRIPPAVAAILAVLVATVAGGRDAEAQVDRQRPYRALFGGVTTDPSVQHYLDLTMSLSEVYDDNSLADLGGQLFADVPAVLGTGFYTGLETGLSYGWLGQTVQISASASSALRRYPGERLLAATHVASMNLTARASRRTQILAAQTFRYAPSLFFGAALPADGAAVASEVAESDYVLGALDGYISETRLSLEQGLTRRSSVTILGEYHWSTFDDQRTAHALSAYGAGGRYQYTLARDVSVRLGYVHRRVQFGGSAGTWGLHDIDAGIDYARSLSVSRRTRMDFHVGSSAMSALSSEGGDRAVSRRYAIIGDAGLSHDMGRTWRARVGYNRSVGIDEALAQPFLADALQTSLTGSFNRRVSFGASAATSRGELGDGSVGGADFRTYQATSSVTVGLHSWLALVTEYLYYYYDTGQGVELAFGVPGKLSRHSVRVGVSLWTPLLRR